MILLDDAHSSSAQPTSRLYDSPLQTWCILPSGNTSQDQLAVKNCLAEFTAALDKGHYLVAVFSYELGKLIHHLPARSTSHTS